MGKPRRGAVRAELRVQALGGRPPEDFLYTYTAAIAGAIQYGVILAVLLLISIGHSRTELFALRRPSSVKLAAGLGLLFFLGVFALAAALEPVLEPGREQGLTPDEWRPDRVGAFAANFAVVAGAAPAVEELTFRGLGFSLLERFGRPAAILLTGLAFGLAHGLVNALPILVAFGAALAYMRSRTESVLPCMVLHAVFNGLVLVLAVTIGAENA